MKKIALLTSVLFSLCLSTRSQDIGTDRELDANIEAYQTYDWTNKIDQIPTDAVFIGPNGVTVFNNETVRSKIKASVAYELSARGYKQTEQNPDFLVHFDVLEQPAEIVTYNGYRLLYNGLDTVRTEENVNQTAVEAGTVMVNFIDKKTGEMVWRGYASGILKPDMINDETKVRSAISSIFGEYRFKAKGMQ
jgi:cellobiose-specific phosphotransferase system component IIB